MRSVADRTDCGAEGDAWEGCLTAETSCGWAERCVAEQEAYEACVAPYCQHPGPEAPPDAECALIEEALHPADR
jgi:hypothetical protein